MSRTRKQQRDPEDLLPLRPVIFEMLLLFNEGQRHGYGLMQELRERSGGRWILGPGTLYRTINEMLDQDLIVPAQPEQTPADSRVRRYYRVTPFGRRVAAGEASRMARLVETATLGKLI